jgi:O-methyltransferase
MKTIKRTIEQILNYFGVWKYTYSRYIRLRGLRIIQGPFRYSQDGLYTRLNADFMTDPRFVDAMKAAHSLSDSHRKFETHWRTFVNCWAASHGMNLEGDFVECGVLRGFTAMSVIKYSNLNRSNKRYYLVDTYSGVDTTLTSTAEQLRNIGSEQYADESEWSAEVIETFSEFKNVKVVKGSVPEILSEVDTDKVCYLHIDMNNAAPEIAAARFFWDKLVTGAVVVLDDYGFPKHIGQKHAFDEFAEEMGFSILSLPTGQGMFVKP